jgi:2-iminobutanoate/2-iminopropanoate deaminase
MVIPTHHIEHEAEMSKKIYHSDQAPAALGPYSQAVSAGNLLFISGQLPIDPATGTLVEGDIVVRTHRIIANIKAIAQAAGASLDQVVKTTIFLTDLGDFQAMNSAYGEHFPANPPARSTVQVAGLPLGSNIEIETVVSLV